MGIKSKFVRGQAETIVSHFIQELGPTLPKRYLEMKYLDDVYFIWLIFVKIGVYQTSLNKENITKGIKITLPSLYFTCFI
jgi:hypothetical protein